MRDPIGSRIADPDRISLDRLNLPEMMQIVPGQLIRNPPYRQLSALGMREGAVALCGCETAEHCDVEAA